MAWRELRQTAWATLLRALGIANILLGLWAGKNTVQVLLWYATQREEDLVVSVVFYSMILINCSFAIALAWTGTLLLRMQRGGISWSILLLLGELVYFVFVFAAMRHFPEALAGGQPTLTDVANVGLALQMHVRYPFIALPILGIAYWYAAVHKVRP